MAKQSVIRGGVKKPWKKKSNMAAKLHSLARRHDRRRGKRSKKQMAARLQSSARKKSKKRSGGSGLVCKRVSGSSGMTVTEKPCIFDKVGTKGPAWGEKGRPRLTPRQLKEMQDEHHATVAEIAAAPRKSGRKRKARKRLIEDA